MSEKEDEIRRLQRLSEKHRRARKRATVGDVVMDFPAKWRYLLIGTLVGVLMMLILNILVQASWAQIVGGRGVRFGGRPCIWRNPGLEGRGLG